MAQATDVSAAPETPEAPASEDGEREGGRRRGRGRDRYRREPREQDGNLVVAAEAAAAEALPAVAYNPPAAQAEPETVAPTEAVSVPAVDAVPVPVAETVIAAPVAEPAAQRAEPALVAAAAPKPVEPYALPTADLQSLAAAAGLEWVNSDAEKIRAVQAAMAAEPRPMHVPRVPRARVVIDEGPLVLVETRKDLSQLKLPFEAERRV